MCRTVSSWNISKDEINFPSVLLCGWGICLWQDPSRPLCASDEIRHPLLYVLWRVQFGLFRCTVSHYYYPCQNMKVVFRCRDSCSNRWRRLCFSTYTCARKNFYFDISMCRNDWQKNATSLLFWWWTVGASTMMLWLTLRHHALALRTLDWHLSRTNKVSFALVLFCCSPR